MKINLIHSMWWADEAHTAVGLIADTDNGSNLTVGTPYNETSIIWADIQAFGEENIAPYTPPAPEPVTSVTMRQARLALLGAGLLDTVNASVSSMTPADQIEWQFASTVERNSPLVSNLAIGLGLTEEGLDQLFLTASTL
jgi:hypothetical protein